MHDKILVDENKEYIFDFSIAEYVVELHQVANSIGLNDVDFIIGLDKEIIFLEYKNANIKNASNPKALSEKIKSDKFYNNICKKYYDSLLLFWAMKKNDDELPIRYYLIIEGPEIEERIRKQLTIRIMKNLPLNLCDARIKREMLSDFKVCSIEEWNKIFKNMPISINSNI